MRKNLVLRCQNASELATKNKIKVEAAASESISPQKKAARTSSGK